MQLSRERDPQTGVFVAHDGTQALPNRALPVESSPHEIDGIVFAVSLGLYLSVGRF